MVVSPSSDVSSLANYLMVTDKIFAEILTICGLAITSTSSHDGRAYLKLSTVMGRSSTSYSWNQFLVEHGLEGIYFDKMKVKGVTGGQVYWIGLGDICKDENPSTQVLSRSQSKGHVSLDVSKPGKGRA